MESFHSQETAMESLAQPLQPIKVRCPECLKLYSVNSSEITEARPRFQCIDCRSQFWIAYPECLESQEVVGQLETPSAERNASDRALRECPKCHKKSEGGLRDCPSCGIVFDKYEKRMAAKEDDFPASSRLKEMWKNVLQDYDNEEAHQAFVRGCQYENNLAYASSRYKSLIEIQGDDEISQKMRSEIVALASVKAAIPHQGRERLKKMRPGRRIPLRFSTIIIFLSSMIIAFGYFFPLLRNMVGVGASILFFTLAIRFYLRQVS